MRQATLATAGSERYGKLTRRGAFLDEMERVVPWSELCALIAPVYPKSAATGTIVDATIIHAPSSTKNATQTRDPEMHQTKKGNQWHFGMKAHIGVDSRSKVIHAEVATAAKVADGTVLPDLLHGNETRVWGDQAYRGQHEGIRAQAPKARDLTNRRYRHGAWSTKRRRRATGSSRRCGLGWNTASA